MKHLIISIGLIILFIPATYCQHTNSIYANIPSLKEVSGIWMNTDTLAMEPSLRNFRAQALVNRDIASISWFASVPYSGGYHTGAMHINGKIPRAQLFRWFPYQALRKTTYPDYKILSNVRMLPDNDLIMWEISISNTTDKVKKYNIEQDLIGFISRYPNDVWNWWYPFPSLKGKTEVRGNELVNLVRNIGLEKKDYKISISPGMDNRVDSSMKDKITWPSDQQILNSTKYHVVASSRDRIFIGDTETKCFSAFRLIDIPQHIKIKNSGGTAYWSLTLQPGETKKIRFMMTFAETRQIAANNLNKWGNNFNSTFKSTETIWKERWAAIFKPHNAIISGTFPVLQTNIIAARKVYYAGPLTMLYLMHNNLPVQKRVYLTGGPRWGATLGFLWDLALWSEIYAVADPAILKAQVISFMKVDINKHFAVDNYSGKDVGYNYVADYWSLFQLMHSYITITKDYAFLNEKVNGKKVIDYLTDYAFHWRELSLYGKPGCTDDIYKLADFGDNPWALLECVPTYKHIVPSLNIGYVWMMRETAKLHNKLGNKQLAGELNTEADAMAKRVLKLYAGNGVWYCMYPNNKKVVVRHVLDFLYAGKYMNQDMPVRMKKKMVQFVSDELLTNTWMRALSFKDSVAKFSDRPDHGPMGAYDGWPSDVIDALATMGFTNNAFNFYQAIAPVTNEGNWAQNHELWGEHKYEKNAQVRIAERSMSYRDGSEGIEFSQVMMKNFFGFFPGIDEEIMHDNAHPINFKGKMYNVLYGGKYYDLTSENGKVKMKLSSGIKN